MLKGGPETYLPYTRILNIYGSKLREWERGLWEGTRRRRGMTGAQEAALPPPTPFHLFFISSYLTPQNSGENASITHLAYNHLTSRTAILKLEHLIAQDYCGAWCELIKSFTKDSKLWISAHVQQKKKMLMIICYTESLDWHACGRVVARRVASRDASRRYWIKFWVPLSSLKLDALTGIKTLN